MSDHQERVTQLLFLVWVHGFKGNQATFSDFPADAAKAAQARYPEYDLRSVIYPKYRTVGDLDIATHNFVEWLNRSVLEMEREKVDETGHEVHTTVILLGHSMGGMLVADAAKEVFDARKEGSELGMADVRGVIAIDTPYIGIHPGLVSYGMEQLEGYYDKALLDTAAFFENSPRFVKQGLSKIGISSNRLKPPPTSPDPKPVGRLTKGFTSVLSFPGAVSSSEWDWTRKGRGEGVFGLRKERSRPSPSQSPSLSPSSSRTDVLRVKGKEDEGAISKGSAGESSSSTSSIRSTSVASNRTSRAETPPLPPRRPSTASATSTNSVANGGKAVPPLPPRKAAREAARPRPAPSHSASADEDPSCGSAPSDTAEGDGRTNAAPTSASSADSSVNNKIHQQEDGPDDSARPERERVPSLEVSPPSSSDTAGPNTSTASESAKDGTQGLKSSDSALIVPSTEQSADSSASVKDTSLSAPTGPASPGPDSLLSPQISRASSTSSASSTSAPNDPKKAKKKDWKWVRQHMEFMSSCWNVGDISRRMKGIEAMQREGLYFVNIYTIVRPSPPAHPRDRTFVSLPTIHHLTKDSWKPFVHDSAADQVEAHMALFDKVKHKGYGKLIEMIGDEIGQVLRSAGGKKE